MASEQAHNYDEQEDVEEHFITEDDVLAEVPDDDDHPMDEDDDEAGDTLGDLGQGSSSSAIEGNFEQAFSDHKKSVFTISGHPTQPLAVSGGEDDMGYIWDITDGEVLVKLTGHTDSVTCTGWSNDGEMVATGGMDGKIRLWRRVGKENWRTWEFLTELQGPDEVMFLRWHPKGNVLLAGSNDTTLWLWQLPSGNTMQVFAGHTGPVQCGEFTPDGKNIVSACADGILMYWNPRDASHIFKLTPEGHFNLDGITSIAVNPASTLAVVGGAAGGVRVVSLSKGDVVNALGGHTEGESIESICFVDVAPGASVVATGATDGKICVWDLNTMRLRTTLQHEDAVTTLLSHGHLLVSASADRTLRTWDVKTGALIREMKGHYGPVLAASLGLGGDVVLSAGDEGLCLVYTTEPTESQ
ncbi:WD40-repeat-containing domain protein [Schizophyllum amplum]|uniref:WD40-repeat-containing domain protein n=1 Tax=Schizophyllum amplum TaxID=97359 RepID=A0A550CIP8_9AGAR|nr:WD40-repeat-containing domain protein [Auriculariopsis ampla]